MTWNLNSDRPIYTQIVERIQMQIVSGFYLPGTKLPSVRDLAAEANVNPNTMQKAFAELERSALIVTQRTSGRLVTEDTAMIKEIQANLALSQIKEFMKRMADLGYTPKDVIALLEKESEGELA